MKYAGMYVWVRGLASINNQASLRTFWHQLKSVHTVPRFKDSIDNTSYYETK